MDFPVKTIKLSNGEELGYRIREGGDQKLLLIHGNMTSSKHWDILMEKFDKEYTIYAVDMRGFGASTYKTPINSLKDFAEDINEFMDKMNLINVNVAGWSTGGGVAMILAADHTSKVKKLILIESVGTRGYPMFKKDQTGKAIPGEYLTTKEEIARDPVQVLPVQNAYDNKDKATLKAIWEALIYTHNKPDPEKYDEYIEDMMTQRNLADVDYALVHFNISGEHNGVEKGNKKVQDIDCPVLILWGENDLVVPESMALDIKKDIGENAKLVYLKNSGHSPLIDNLDQLLDNMHTFLRR